MKKKKILPTLIVDTREKRPWSFDGDPDFEDVIHTKLEVGDYSIVGLEQHICIERKLSADELYVNVFNKINRERLRREMERFRGVTHRFIIIEEDLSDVLDPDSYYVNTSGRNKRSKKMPIAIIMRELLDFMLNYGVHVIFTGGKGQNLAKSLLIKAYKEFDAKSIAAPQNTN